MNHQMKITEVYKNYTSSVSTKGMAASLELCLYVFNLCEKNQYKNIIDCGSGITSYVLRYYQSINNDVVVYSVDDHDIWLQKSKDFVESYDLNVNHFIHGMENITDITFDLVIHDYGRMPARQKMLEYVLNVLSAPGTDVILDDCHKPGYYNFAKSVLNSKKLNFNKIEETVDGLGRFSVLTRIT
jgi:hypothetical protein